MRSSWIRLATLLVTLTGMWGCGSGTTPTAPIEKTGPTADHGGETTPASAPAPENPAASSGLIPALEPQAGRTASPDMPDKSAAAPAAAESPSVTEAAPVARPVNRREWLEEMVAAREADQPDKNNLKQIGLALHNFHDNYSHFPSINSMGNADSKKGLSWRVHLLPYMDETELYNEFHLDEPWNSEHNKTLIERMPATFGRDKDGKTRYQVFTGRNVPFQLGKGPAIRDITDGTSNTIAVIMSGEDKADIWTKPGGLPFDNKKPGAVLGTVGDTTLALWGDGRVSKVDVKSPSLAWMIQHADGNKIPDSEFAQAEKEAPAVAFTSEPPPPLAPPASKVDIRYIPADALAVMIVQPRRMVEHPVVQKIAEAANWTDDSKESFMLGAAPPDMRDNFDEFSINPLLVEDFRVVIGSQILQFDPTNPVKSPAVLAIVRTAAPYNERALVQNFIMSAWEGIEVRDTGELSYLHNIGKDLSFLPISDREFAVGHENVLKSAFNSATAATPATPLIKRLTASGNGMFLAASVITPAVREQVQLMAQQAPPQAALFMPYLLQLAGVSLAVDLDAPQLLSLQAQFEKPELAEGLAGMLDAQLSMGKQQFEQMKPLITQGENAAAEPLMTELVTGLKLVSRGDTVTFTAARPKKLDDLPVLLAPAFAQARAAAGRTEKQNNLKQIGLAMHNFHDTYNHLPAVDGSGDSKGKSGLSWRVYLLPFLDQAPLYNQFKLNEPWDSEHNKTLIAKMPKIFGEDPEFKTSIHVITGNGAPFQKGVGLRFREVTDGLSNTILAVEAGPDTADIWTKPTALEFSPEDALKCLGTLPADQEGFQMLLADGSVRYVLKTIAPDVFRKLVQYKDGETLGEF